MVAKSFKVPIAQAKTECRYNNKKIKPLLFPLRFFSWPRCHIYLYYARLYINEAAAPSSCYAYGAQSTVLVRIQHTLWSPCIFFTTGLFDFIYEIFLVTIWTKEERDRERKKQANTECIEKQYVFSRLIHGTPIISLRLQTEWGLLMWMKEPCNICTTTVFMIMCWTACDWLIDGGRKKKNTFT